MNEEKYVAETRVRSIPLGIRKFFELARIHELLPSEDDDEGLTIHEIRAALQRIGVVTGQRSIERAIESLAEIAYIERLGQRPARFRRLYSESLFDLFDPGVIGTADAAVPDWPSGIVLKRGSDPSPDDLT